LIWKDLASFKQLPEKFPELLSVLSPAVPAVSPWGRKPLWGSGLVGRRLVQPIAATEPDKEL